MAAQELAAEVAAAATDDPAPRVSESGGYFPTSEDGYEKLKLIGRGAFAEVWKARVIDGEEGQFVAIKIINLETMQSNAGFDELLQEVQTMKMCNHRNVLGLNASFIVADELWLVTRLMDKGSLMHVMRLAKHQGLGEGMRESILEYVLREVLKGMKYLHEQGYIHRDIKAGNILVDSEGNVRLADFGVSGWLVDQGFRKRGTKTFVGTPCWMAPEVMEQDNSYDSKADIWSFGITALELAKGHAPYAKYPPMSVLIKTIQNEPPSLKTYDDDKQVNGEPFSRAFKEMVRLCLQKDSARRPNTSTLLGNKFFKNQATREALVNELLAQMPDVGAGGNMIDAERLPGTRLAELPLGGADEAAAAPDDADAEMKANEATVTSNTSNAALPDTVQNLMKATDGQSAWAFTPVNKDEEADGAKGDDPFLAGIMDDIDALGEGTGIKKK
uniref:Protein kinase domain-containing protein n=1 Tax=Phaeomonas parva TaxID=124430 RepID=A0A7S1XVM3_9STRA|mmetsp:Transcript_37983/g.119187  ORF Transcript_37983/g.119187 Transcript_37983/m.119187 type:complete len:444 (+) Transcript_37983:166-1497(+)